MNVHSGSLMQIVSNTNHNITYPVRGIENIAFNYQDYNFINSSLIVSRNVDKLCPEYIVFDLIDENISLDTLFNYSRNIYITFKVGEQNIIDFPLNLLWNLKQPEIMNNKLYLSFPFEYFFGDIFLNSLYYHEVIFQISNFDNLANYSSICSLLCKTVIYCNRTRIYEPSNNIIQQISSLELNVSNSEPENTSNEFVINTNMFKGFIKGFFIESTNIDELNKLQFFINGHTRVNYNRFLIRNKCIKINNDMLFYSFNNEPYQNRSWNSYDGSINLDNIDSQMCITFTNPRNKVKIYSLNINYYNQTNGIGSLIYETNIFHRINDFSRHQQLSVEEITSQPVQVSFNVVPQINNYNNYNNYVMDTSGVYLSNIQTSNIQTSNIINQIIAENRKICGISLDEIQLNDRYMTCSNCVNNYKEQEIKRWLQTRNTCPSCRSSWLNYNVYINALPIS